MRILRYASDLHLEHLDNIYDSKIIELWNFNTSDMDEYYLALVGDIGNPLQKNLELFLEKVSSKYSLIFYVPGNHEYYNLNKNSQYDIEKFKKKLRKICYKFHNIVFMDNESYDLEDIKFIGSTLWSHIPINNSLKIEQSINDYYLIKKFNENKELEKINCTDTNKWNNESIDYIKKELTNTDKPCIILTHHAPLFSDPKNNKYTADPQYINSPNNFAFHNDLSEIITYPIILWIYGHTHYCGTFKHKGIFLSTNQLGYNHETIKFNSNAYYNLDDLIIKSL
ncbi:metallophosphoesterase-like protein [Moumouvirus goulette]|uniref:Metallophosphoesterase-like protein n=1 Tax=Moumouvirus goulette TaxID=1247379 RepID=M1PWQ2_9VIRU|nr:metallophosphoesterase-like protein [Moumouvirus goulette]AGF85187.1 metallophosphoesterase-like protein [Moumouvirus goulette]